ncbi:hypothetical protein BpHYR1_008546 [Brachionus plicatilis]|uniref:Uncharacterized protein n=1 Tax=Brachionus plicatilis TaxID=10195 RepID=A0A3M7T4N6_BRAPC|nr:hypothetical protein BpHYR1_008546 [Brachionus plicatilis]
MPRLPFKKSLKSHEDKDLTEVFFGHVDYGEEFLFSFSLIASLISFYVLFLISLKVNKFKIDIKLSKL